MEQSPRYPPVEATVRDPRPVTDRFTATPEGINGLDQVPLTFRLFDRIEVQNPLGHRPEPETPVHRRERVDPECTAPRPGRPVVVTVVPVQGGSDRGADDARTVWHRFVNRLHCLDVALHLGHLPDKGERTHKGT